MSPATCSGLRCCIWVQVACWSLPTTQISQHKQVSSTLLAAACCCNPPTTQASQHKSDPWQLSTRARTALVCKRANRINDDGDSSTATTLATLANKYNIRRKSANKRSRGARTNQANDDRGAKEKSKNQGRRKPKEGLTRTGESQQPPLLP